jgi:hypothetical protein
MTGTEHAQNLIVVHLSDETSDLGRAHIERGDWFIFAAGSCHRGVSLTKLKVLD